VAGGQPTNGGLAGARPARHPGRPQV